MDSHQLSGSYGATGAGLSNSTSNSTIPSIPNRLFSYLKSDIGISPNSPFSTQFDCDTNTALSDNQEQHSSTKNLSGLSPSCNSSLESNNYFHPPSPSVNCRNTSLPIYSGGTSYTQDANSSHNMIHGSQELETAVIVPEGDEEVKTPSVSSGESSRPKKTGLRSRSWNQERRGSLVLQPQTSFVSRHRQSTEVVHDEKRQKSIADLSSYCSSPGNLKQLLIACAQALSENNMDELIRLVARKEASGSNIYRALRCREPEGRDLLSYMHILYEICPYLKFGYLAANGAIAEACRTEDHIHIIDFQIAQGTQWVTLLQALAARPGGAPHVRITGIDDPVSKYARGGGLEAVGRRLSALSEQFNISVEFYGFPVFAPDITRDMIRIRPGEALAVNFPLQLHHTPDESVDVNNPRDGLLRLVKSLSPKVTTLVEQESNTNTAPFVPRFIETLEYYLAMFESMDETLPRDGKENQRGAALPGSGYRQHHRFSYVNSVIGSLLKCYSKHYTLSEKDGAMLLGWKGRNLISASLGTAKTEIHTKVM
ncbi:Chitin-inducible gibberellin-responsive protein 2 [Hibiscus syriacus]|uniref:Chitin-inducible gibberellin-responsive protein 2 n=1 Tax=Hibiscus syriacus TaxID=106335 RepID=A0A6A2ZN36_HIBSY|nr:Chitin-inducible gibberellin-responsive protein 2 [Hibiscus syriacus]